MRANYLVGFFLLILAIACTDDAIEIKTPIDYSSIFVSSIKLGDSIVYTVNYEDDRVKSIIKRTEINFKNQKYLVDSTMFFYSNNQLDSAIFYEDIYYNYNFFINEFDYFFKEPVIHGFPIGIIYGPSLGPKIYKDTSYTKFERTENKIKVKKWNNRIDTNLPYRYVYEFSYNERNNLVEQSNSGGRMSRINYYYYDSNDNVVNSCSGNECLRTWKYDDNPNPFYAINDKLGYPYFINGLSFNNPIEYELYSSSYIIKTKTDRYAYDAKRRPILINEKIIITYKNN